MKPHHKKAIENLTDYLKQNNKYFALIITGSVAKGQEKEDSDIDFVLVVTDEEFEKRKVVLPLPNLFIFFNPTLFNSLITSSLCTISPSR